MPDPSSPTTSLRRSRGRNAAEQWALVLVSQGIDSRVARSQGGWVLLVATEDVEDAERALDTWERENRPRESVAPPPPEYGPTRAGFVASGLLLAAWLATGPPDRTAEWFRRGSASAERILAGELWRTVTALTLHVDLAHLFANVAACALFVTFVGRALGPGLGGLVVLLSGAFGNFLNALAYGSDHTSIGASTAIFGAVGVLAGMQAVRRRVRGFRGSRVWAPLAAGLALLAMLGTGERADLWAHLFGFLSGGLLGLPLGALRRAPGRPLQWLLVAVSVAIVAWSWWIALGWAPDPTLRATLRS
jgi:membrane associated rhomboid family serine protease